MKIVLYMLDCAFVTAAFCLFKENLGSRRLGSFVGPQNLGRFVVAFVLGASGVVSCILQAWWPLAVGTILAVLLWRIGA